MSAEDAVSDPPSSESHPTVPASGPKSGRRRRVGRFLGPRIAQRIFLGFILPLFVLFALGLVVPIFLWSYLGQARAELDQRTAMADRASALQAAAIESESHAINFLRYHDKQFEDQFTEARDNFRLRYRDVSDYVDQQENPTLNRALDNAYHNYNTWLRDAINTPFRAAQIDPKPGPNAEVIARNAHKRFVAVRSSFETLLEIIDAYRADQVLHAHVASLLREILAFTLPVCAVLLSLLVGRLMALGITRPLETLINAAEHLEQGNSGMLIFENELLSDSDGSIFMTDADDEIGDLQRAFRQMARTIQQREAVLRTQNEAFGALIRRIEAVLNATNDGILLIDRGGGFSIVNQRLADIFDLQVEELQDHTWVQAGPLLLSRFRNKPAVRDRIRDILNDNESITDETFDTDGPGALRSLRVYSAPVRGALGGPEDELLGRILVFRDVTRETMVDRMKTEFVSTVSHELRTPLTAIKGYVDLIVSGQTGPVTSVQNEFLTLVQGSTRRLTTLINDMLDISRIESGRMDIRSESVEYLPLVRDAVRMMQQEADARQIKLEIEVKLSEIDQMESPQTSVIGDGDRITQVLTNFLSNGIKYTPPGGSVTLRIQYEDEFVTTCVADTGIGISPEDQRKLFQKFFRADNSTTREAGGTGLGLAISKAILEKLNGSVWVESERGQGSRFWFTLPTTAAPEELEASLKNSDSRGGASRSGNGVSKDLPAAAHRLILSVDGDISLLHRLGHELRRQGFYTTNAANFADAFRRARDLRPDLITLDPLSPHFDGFAFLRVLRGNEATRAIPVALIAPIAVGGRMEMLDTIEYLPRSAPVATLGGALREAIARSDQTASQSEDRSGTALVMVGIGDDLAGRVQAALRWLAPHMVISLAQTTEDAELAVGAERMPDLIVMDTRLLPGTSSGAWLARLRRRHSGARPPLLVLAEDDICAGATESLVPFGSGTVSIEDIGLGIRVMLEENDKVQRRENAAVAKIAVQ